MLQQRFKLHIFLNYGKIERNVVSWSVLMLKVALTWPWSHNDRHLLHVWLDKDYSLPGMMYAILILICYAWPQILTQSHSTQGSLHWEFMLCQNTYMFTTILIPAKPLHNHDIVLVHFNHFHYIGICDKLRRHLSLLTYLYLNMHECWLRSSIPK